MQERPDDDADDDGGDRRGTLPSWALVADSVVSPPLREDMASAGPNQTIPVVVEPRNAYDGGVPAARERIRDMVAELDQQARVRDVGAYLATRLTAAQIGRLVEQDRGRTGDAAGGADDTAGPSSRPAPRGAIHRLWPDFAIGALIHRTVVTTKCQAVHRSFAGLGQDIVWAVLDSGIDAAHPHFRAHQNLVGLPTGLRHRSFVDEVPEPGPDVDPAEAEERTATALEAAATVDVAGLGTHVAGIIAGELLAEDGPALAATWYRDDTDVARVTDLELDTISGMAPRAKLLSCKVLRDDGTGDVGAVLAALDYVNHLNDGGRDLRVQGVNLSVGYPFDPSWFAAGLTPVCREVNRLVESGVVVVVAAGNTGSGWVSDDQRRSMRVGMDLSINDPGNAELAITVGSTSTSPHTTGVSYFSSKGPTGDGRPKPDLVAPGERIVSARARGAETASTARTADAVASATYVEDSGTSMAAPHVSGAAAGLLSVHREFVGQPRLVKQVLMDSATDLGRAREFQGRGMLDAMRAIQSV